jgi:hypothetical protein
MPPRTIQEVRDFIRRPGDRLPWLRAHIDRLRQFLYYEPRRPFPPRFLPN